MADIASFLFQYKAIILFYLIIIVWLILQRKKLSIYAKFIILYRMKLGLKWMDRCATRFREWIVLLGYIGVGAGFLGLVLISYVLIKNLYDLSTQPAAVNGVSLVLPGISVPGIGVLPFWDWIIAIFIIAAVHEFSHGIVARAHNIPVQHTGIVLFGPILGAFVEPDEKKLRKEKDIAQYSVYAAGSFSNVLLALLAIALLFWLLLPAQQAMSTPMGFTFDEHYGEEYPFAKAGIAPGTVITGINGVPTGTFQEFYEELSHYRPGEEIMVMTENREYEITLAANPENPRQAFLGISQIRPEVAVRDAYTAGAGKILYAMVQWLAGFFRWLFVLSLGIGLFNLLPLPIVDGGRMTQAFLHRLKGADVGERRYRQVGVFFLLLLLLNLFFPLLSRLF